MRRMWLFLTLAVLCSACSGGMPDDAGRVREHYAALAEFSCRATLRTDFGDRVTDFTVDYTAGSGGGRMTVVSPDIIAGIGAEIGADGVSLRYDGLTLELGALPGTGLSPMESLPFIVSQWSGGYVTQTGREKRAGRTLITVATRVTQGGAAVDVTTWFDCETLRPLTAELAVNGFLTVTALFEE